MFDISNFINMLKFLSWSAKEYAEFQIIFTEIINKSWALYDGQLTQVEYIKNFNWFETWFSRHKIEFLNFFNIRSFSNINIVLFLKI